MSLPYPNPADPSYPNPYFQDNEFVRGDQMRGNNQFIWENLGDLDTRVTSVEGSISTLTPEVARLSLGLIPGRNIMPLNGRRTAASATFPWHPIAVTRTFAQADAPDFVNYLYSVPFEVGGVDEFAITNAVHAAGMGTGVQKLTFSSSTAQARMFAALLDMMAFRSYSFTTNDTTAAQLLTIAAVSTGTNTVNTLVTNRVSTGHPVTLFAAPGGALPTGISEGIVYYARASGTTTLSFHPTIDDAINGTNIVDITSNGSGTMYIDTRSAKAQLTLSIASTIGHITPGNYAISAIDSSNRCIWITGSNNTAGGAVAGNVQFYKHRVAGSTTSVIWHAIEDAAIMTPLADGSIANGTMQLDQMQGHRHNIGVADNGGSASQPGVVTEGAGNNWVGTGASFASQALYVGNPRSDGTNGTPRTGATTRPRSLVVDWCIYVGANTL